MFIDSRQVATGTHIDRDDSLGVEFANNGKHNSAQRHKTDVVAAANQCCEQQPMSGGTEHITVDLLPTILISQVTFLYNTHNVH